MSQFGVNYKCCIKLIFLTAIVLLIAVQPAYSLENADIIKKEFYFEEPVVEKGVDGYDIVMVPSLRIYGNPGMPVLPYKTIELLLPPNSEVTGVDVSPSQEIKINGSYLIEPGQNPVPISEKDKTNFTPPNETIYKSDNPYPKEIYKIISVENVCGYRVLLLNIYPVKYYPKSGNVSFFPEIAVTVETSEVSNTLAINANDNFRGSVKDTMRVAYLVDNPETLKKYSQESVRPLSTTALPLSSTSYDYIIITNNTLKPTFQGLADWKNSSGVNTTIMTVEDISIIYSGADLQEKIRNFIKDAYNSWGITYVLLGGDTDIIPHRGFYVDVDGTIDYDIPSDLYYAALDGTWNNDSDSLWGEPGEEDLYAEVYVGRAPVGNIAEVNNFINKTIAYENLSGSEFYLKKTLMVGEKLDSITWGGDYKDEIKSYLTPPWMSSSLYDRDYPGNDWPKSEIISRINDEQHLINHLGHSNVNYGLKMSNSDINDLTNSNYSLIYTQGCYSGAFDNRGSSGTYYNDCISESFVVEEHGAFAMIANSRYGWYSPGSTDGPSQYFDREFFDAIFNENIRNIGKALQDSKEDNAGLVSSPYMRWCYYEINLLGDPQTVIHEPIPEPHDIYLTHLEAPTLIKVNEEAVINVTVNNIGQNNENNIEVNLIVDEITEDTQIISTLNISSSRKLSFNWTTDIEGTYSLTIYAVPVAGEAITSNNYVQTNISVTSAQILLVDDDESANYETYYSMALNDYGYSHAMWNVLTQGAPTTEDLQSYEIVIWLTGNDWLTTLTSTDQANLTAFLDNGGRLFISGQDIGYSLTQNGTVSNLFYSTYLYAQYVSDNVNLTDLNGVSGDPITDNINISISGGDGADNQLYPSEISPNDVYATPVFHYNGDGVGAIRVDTGTYRVVYFAFGFEAVNDRWDRAYLMYRITRWLDIQPPSVWVPDYGATYVPAGEPVTINAYVSDQSSNVSSVYARIESPDENIITTIQLFDDGMHFDGAENDGKYGNSWTTGPDEKDYYVDIIANDTWNNSAEYDNIDRFTTVSFTPTSDILLVDDSTYESYINYYEGALNSTSYSYNTWDQDLRGVIDSSILNSFKICIWSSPFGGPDSYEQSILREFLDNGGRLFISGQDIGWSLTQNGSVSNPFYSTYLHAQYVSDDVNLYDLSGVSGDPITDNINVSISGGDGANNQAWPSEIDPIAPAESIFHYNEFSILSEENLTLQELPSALQEDINKSLDYSTMGTSSSGTGALRVDNGTYRVAYFAFGFEAINDEWDRTYLMNRIIRWLDIQPPSVWVPDYGATYVPAGNPVTINAYVYDESSNVSSVHARIESPDENIITTIQLFDDGMHYDGSANDGTYGNSWTTDPDEKDYYVDIIANDTWNNSAEYDNIDRFTTVLFTPTSNILLVDDSTYVSYINYYEDSLNYNNYSFDLWDYDLRGSIESSIINSFKMCIWSSPFGGPDSYEQSVLREFLDNGGRLFISGQDIGYYIGSTNFYSDYLHALYVSDDVNLYDLSGVSGDLITDDMNISIFGGDGANNQWFPSEIDPIAPAESIFHYDIILSKEILTLLRPPSLPEEYLNRATNYNTSGISSSGTGALRIDTGIYRVVYFAFGFEAINSSADRDMLMNKIVSRWIDAIPPDVSGIVPANNTNVSGIQWINATATDNIGVYSVTANVSNSTWARIYTLTQYGDVWYNDSWNTTQQADGSYNLSINATDVAGNYNDTENVTIMIDNTPPSQSTITSPMEGSLLNGTVNINATASDALSGVARVTFLANDTIIGSDTSPPYSLVWNTIEWLDGDYLLKVITYDWAGNTNISAPVNVVLDNMPPSAFGEIPANSSFVHDTTPLISVNITDNASGVNLSSVVMTVNEDVVDIANISIAGGYMVYNQTATPFTHTQVVNVTVNATDNNSNFMSYNWSFTVDGSAPILTYPVAVPSTIESNGTDTTTLSINITDDLSGISSVTINLSSIGGLTNAVMTNDSTTFSITTNATGVGNGTFYLPVNATDNAGNSNTSVNITLNITDTILPTLSNNMPATGTTNLSPTISINATDIGSGINVSSANMTVNDVEVLLANAHSAFTYNFSNTTTTSYSHGDKVNVTFSVSDKQGHTSNEPWSFYIDNVNPTISITSPVGGYSTTASSISVSGAVNGTGSPPVVTVNGISTSLSSLENFSGTFTVAFVPISLGSNIIYANVTDAAGNINSTSISVTRTSPPPPPPSGGGGGGGGGSTGEEYENIEFKDVSRVYVSTGADISFTFDKTGNDIQSINYKALTSAGYISATIEVLKDTSALVKHAPSGIVYKNMNIWVGKFGYATAHNIENPVIGFKVKKSWIQDNRIDEDSIKLNRYSDDVWTALPTTRTDEDATFVYFESQTPGFSPFAITAQEKILVSPVVAKTEAITEAPTPTPAITPAAEVEAPPEPTPIGKYLLTGAVILLIVAGAYLYLRKQQS